MNRLTMYCALLFCLSTASSVRAQDASETLPSVTVIGTGKITVEPDIVRVHLGVTTFHKELGEAKSENDKRVSNILAVLKDLSLSEEDYRTHHVSVEPVYEGGDWRERRDKLLGYEVSNQLSIVLKDLTKLDTLLTRCIVAGANTVDSVSFESSTFEEYRNQAIVKAVRNAREKAELMAAELGQSIGKARQISDTGSRPRPLQSGGGLGGGQFLFGGGLETRETIAFGTIEITASVLVTFGLQ